MPVWILFLVLVTPVPGIENFTFLNKFDTLEACKIEEARIGAEMATAYPGDTSFRIECQKKEQITPAVREPAPSEHNGFVNYDKILMDWAVARFPGEPFRLRVYDLNVFQLAGPEKDYLAFSITLDYGKGKDNYLLVVTTTGSIYGWTKILTDPDDIKEHESFPNKDQT